DVASGPNSPCASLAARTERQSSTAGKVTGFELVSGLEKFYADPANALVPIGSAIRIYLLQASGKDQTTIQELIETARLLGASRRASKFFSSCDHRVVRSLARLALRRKRSARGLLRRRTATLLLRASGSRLSPICQIHPAVSRDRQLRLAAISHSGDAFLPAR